MTARCYIEEESAKQAMKQLRSAEGEHRQHPVYFLDEPTRHYVVDDHGCITQYNWHTEQAGRGYAFSGGWRVHKLRERSAAGRELGALDWKGIKRRLDAGDALRGYLYDLDHGSVRGWSKTVVFHKRSPQVVEGAKDDIQRMLRQRKSGRKGAAVFVEDLLSAWNFNQRHDADYYRKLSKFVNEIVHGLEERFERTAANGFKEYLTSMMPVPGSHPPSFRQRARDYVAAFVWNSKKK